MIIFDASYLIVHLHPYPETPMDRENKPVAKFRERVDSLIATLNAADQVIGVPTPALAEILVRAGKGKFKYLQTLNDSWRFEILSFDKLAAIDAGELIAKIKNEHKSQPVDTWAKVKFDIQIAAIGKAAGATAIYSDDKQIEAHGKRLNIKVVRICDLPLPAPPDPEKEAAEEARRQTRLLFPEGVEHEQKGETVISEPSVVQAGDSSSTGDSAGGQKSGEAKPDEPKATAAATPPPIEPEKPKPTAKDGLGEDGP
jgi:predicted nucleic acid-binding protein